MIKVTYQPNDGEDQSVELDTQMQKSECVLKEEDKP